MLLVGGTDGGNAEVLLACARALAAARWRGPVVVAGNVEARDEVAAMLDGAGTPLRARRQRRAADRRARPRVGARTAIREMFLLPRDRRQAPEQPRRLPAMVQGATPDVVLTGGRAARLGRALGRGDVVVVDVGGATTDVHSVVELDPEDAGLGREVVATTPVTRTVEGDLGHALARGDHRRGGRPRPTSSRRPRAAPPRRDDPAFLPDDDAEADVDEEIAREAVGLALRRHAGRSKVVVSPEGRVVERSGKDLREVDLLVGSGGVLRHGRPGVAERVFAGSVGDDVEGGWQLPARAPAVTVDADYVLAAAGLLAAEHRDAARRLVGRLRRAHEARVG